MKKINSTYFLIYILVFLFCNTTVRAQQSDTLAYKSYLDRLKIYGDSLLKGSSDSVRTINHQNFSLLIDSILHQPTSTSLTFYQVPALSVVTSPDNKFRIFNWMLQAVDKNHFAYFGYVQVFDKKTGSLIYKLNEKEYADNPAAELVKVNPSEWYGCIYYKIIHQHKKKKDYYLLLGWAPHTNASTRKVIEPFVLNTPKITFGANVLKVGGRGKMRMIFEYNSQVTMNLRFDDNLDLLVFDHLSSSDPRPESKGIYSLYGPDLSYDGLKFEDGYWTLLKDIDPHNKSNNEGKKPDMIKSRITKRKGE